MDYHIKELLKRFVNQKSISDGYFQQKIRAIWKKEMSPSIVSRTRSIAFKNDTLIVHIESAPLKNELFNSRERIIEIINKGLGEKKVSKVVFR